jgi:MIP family channel proteins
MTAARRGQDSSGRRAPGLAGALAGELAGTFIIVFFGTASVLATKGENIVAVGLTFGFAVLLAIYALGHASGAHFNPAVSVGLAVIGKFPMRMVPLYAAVQLAGGLLASLAVFALFGEAGRAAPLLLGATAPGKGFRGGDALLAEFLITAILLLVIVGTATDDRADTPAVGLGVGFTIGAGVLAIGPVSGASFNPVRALSPMLVAGEFPSWGAYVVGPLAGAIRGALLYDRVIRAGSPPDLAGAVEEGPKG